MQVGFGRCSTGALLLAALGLGGCGGCEGSSSPTNEAPSTSSAAASASASPGDAGALAPIGGDSKRDPTGVRRCCDAIGQNIANAPAEHRATWEKAFEACRNVVTADAGRAGLAPIRTALKEVGYPAACQ